MKKCKKIWIINQYSSTPTTSLGGRHFYLAQELAKNNISVDVIGASYTHLLSNPHKFKGVYKQEKFDGFTYYWLKTISYLNSSSKLRIINWILFSFLVFFLPFIIRNKPNIIIYSSPSLFGSIPSFFLARLLKARFIFEVRDIWTETLVTLGGYSKNSLPIRVMYAIERFMYKHADKVISNLPHSVDHMEKSGMPRDKFAWIPNGISSEEVSLPEDLSLDIEHALPKDKFLIGYVGSLGQANCMETLLSAAANVKHLPDVHFVMVGKGASKEKLIELSVSLGADNVSFLPPIPKRQVQSLMRRFDVCYIGWKNEELYQYGISPNKLPEYMYSGKPVLHSFSGKGDFVKISNAGVSVAAEDAEAVTLGIVELYNMSPEQRRVLGENGKKFVVEQLTYKKISKKLIDVLELV